MDVLIDNGYGDNGKGKVTDYFAGEYDIVARFAGANNAGHTLYYKGEKVILHHIPSGILQPNTINVMGNGMVINPIDLMVEINELRETLGDNVMKRIKIMSGAQVVTPVHLLRDLMENGHIGTTGKGIGPAYEDRVGRRGIRMVDILNDNLDIGEVEKQYKLLFNEYIKNNDSISDKFYPKVICEQFSTAVEFLRNEMDIVKDDYMYKQWVNGKKIFAEGAQGTMLDIDYGSYPYVTSSNTISSNACIGLGLPPQSVDRVFGVSKCYLTRVGNGDMVTEIDDVIGEKIQELGGEVGATTGRKRRCGWLNLNEVKRSVQINGVTDLVITKLDVLQGFDEVMLYFEGSYKTFKGWNSVEYKNNTFVDEKLEKFINFIEIVTNTKVSYISVSPNREGLIKLM